jgi:hypothetical protein
MYSSQSISLPTSVGSFVWYVVNEGHENTRSELHKKVSDHNPDYLPANLVTRQGVNLSFLDADAPWDTPHPHIITIANVASGNVIYTTGKLDYTNSSQPAILPVGKYNLTNAKYPWMKGTITITDQKSNGNLVTRIVYNTTQPLSEALSKLAKMVWNNVYI